MIGFSLLKLSEQAASFLFLSNGTGFGEFCESIGLDDSFNYHKWISSWWSLNMLSVTVKQELPFRNNLAQNHTINRELCLSSKEMNVCWVCLVEKSWGRVVSTMSIKMHGEWQSPFSIEILGPVSCLPNPNTSPYLHMTIMSL